MTSSSPSTKTKLRTLENCEQIACTRCSVKRANEATEPETSAIDEDLGFGRPRRLEAEVDGHPAGREASAHGVSKVDRTATATPALAREAHREFSTERSKRALELGHLLAIRVHDV